MASIHLAGAGNMVTLLIQRELDLPTGTNIEVAEQIKRYPLAKVESLFHIRNEDNSVRFFKDPLDPRLFGRVALVTGADYEYGHHAPEYLQSGGAQADLDALRDWLSVLPSIEAARCFLPG